LLGFTITSPSEEADSNFNYGLIVALKIQLEQRTFNKILNIYYLTVLLCLFLEITDYAGL
jgi:hypothetical protein